MKSVSKLIEFKLFNTPGTRGGPDGRDRTLGVKNKKTPTQFFSLGRFPEVGQKHKTEERKKKEKEEKNGQLRIANATLGGARKAAWAKRRGLNDGNNNGARCTQAAWAIFFYIPSSWVKIGWNIKIQFPG